MLIVLTLVALFVILMAASLAAARLVRARNRLALAIYGDMGVGGGGGQLPVAQPKNTQSKHILFNFQRFLRSKYFNFPNKKTDYGSLCFFTSENITCFFSYNFFNKGVVMHYKSIFNTAVAVTAAAFFCVGCSEKPDNEGGNVTPDGIVYGTPVTYGGETYQTVVIGTQTWFARNLNVAAENSACYNNRADMCAKYGRLYDWPTALTVCPSGWHLPSKAEWSTLWDFVDGWSTSGTKLKSKTGWYQDEDENDNGTDDYGFSALPGGIGYRSSGGSIGFDCSDCGFWWSATESGDTGAWSFSTSRESVSGGEKTDMYSVRCVQD